MHGTDKDQGLKKPPSPNPGSSSPNLIDEAQDEIPLASFEDSLRSQAILDALKKSANNCSTGLSSWIPVELDDYYG